MARIALWSRGCNFDRFNLLCISLVEQPNNEAERFGEEMLISAFCGAGARGLFLSGTVNKACE